MAEQDPTDPEQNPFHRVTDHWGAVIEDAHATAEQYRERGWTVVALHPGDVTVLTGQPRTAAEHVARTAPEQSDGGRAAGEDSEPDPRRLGFDVVVPGDEFDRLQAVLADRPVGDCTVFGAAGSGVVYLVVALETADESAAALVPLYYDRTDREALREVADEHGLYTHVRPLANDRVVTVEHDDPDPFFPALDGA